MYRGRHLLTSVNLSLTRCSQVWYSASTSSKSHQIGRRSISTSVGLSPEKVTEILTTNEVYLGSSTLLPVSIKSVECNQLASNNPIEDRIRISSIHYPGLEEPTVILGVFDGHGGGTTADIICRRLFNYIAIALHPDPSKLKISNRLSGSLIDLHNSPKLNNDPRLQTIETDLLINYRDEILASDKSWSLDDRERTAGISPHDDVAAKLKASFQRCDDDLSQEIQESLISPSSSSQQALIHYSHAAVSGCCAIVMVLHQGLAYIASSGDCRAALGLFDPKKQSFDTNGVEKTSSNRLQWEATMLPNYIHPSTCSFRAIELNDEHNCDNINEVRRLAATHPRSEQNTIIKHNRLLGHLMPFRAFGDFQYKWTADIIKACGLTRTFQYFRVIPEHYETPPYLITEPDIKTIKLDDDSLEAVDLATKPPANKQQDSHLEKYIVLASDGLWELFESSRDVVETLVDHTINAYREGNEEDYDDNSATYLLRSALRYGPHQDISMDRERLRQLYHVRLQSTLMLPKTVARNYRDDISIILLKL